MKISRRRLAGMVVAPAALMAQAQAPAPIPRTPDEELAAVREQNRRTFETLEKFKIPMETEPAFQFKA